MPAPPYRTGSIQQARTTIKTCVIISYAHTRTQPPRILPHRKPSRTNGHAVLGIVNDGGRILVTGGHLPYLSDFP
jgi:hypothetical protein